jgi:hypothetical protein
MEKLENIVRKTEKKGIIRNIGNWMSNTKLGNFALGASVAAGLYLGSGVQSVKAAEISDDTSNYTFLWTKPANHISNNLPFSETTNIRLNGYRIHFKTGSSGPIYDGTDLIQGNSPIDIPIESLLNPFKISKRLHGFRNSEIYFAAATAYNDAGESPYSNETDTNNVPTNEKPIIDMSESSLSIALGNSINWGATAIDPDGSVTDQEFYVKHANGSSIYEKRVAGTSLVLSDFPSAGVYRVTHTATDNTGSYSHKVNNLAVGLANDNNSPQITVTDYTPTVIGDTLQRTGYITDDTAIDIGSIEITLDNVDITDNMKLTYETEKRVSFLTGIKNVGEGSHGFMVSVSDVFGNVRAYGDGQENVAPSVPEIITDNVEADFSSDGFNLKIPIDGGMITSTYMDINGTILDFVEDNGNFVINDSVGLADIVKQNGTVNFNLHVINGVGDHVVKNGSLKYESSEGVSELIVDDMENLFTPIDTIPLADMEDISNWYVKLLYSEIFSLEKDLNNFTEGSSSLGVNFTSGIHDHRYFYGDSFSDTYWENHDFLRFWAKSEKPANMDAAILNGSAYSSLKPFNVNSTGKYVMLDIKDWSKDDIVRILFYNWDLGLDNKISIDDVSLCNLDLDSSSWNVKDSYQDIFSLSQETANPLSGNSSLKVDFTSGIDSYRYFHKNIDNQDWSNYSSLEFLIKSDLPASLGVRIYDASGYSYSVPVESDSEEKKIKFSINDMNRSQVMRVLFYNTDLGYDNSIIIDDINLTNDNEIEWNKFDDMEVINDWYVKSTYSLIYSLSQENVRKIEGNSSLAIDFNSGLGDHRYFHKEILENNNWSDTEFMRYWVEADQFAEMDMVVRDVSGTYTSQKLFEANSEGKYVTFDIRDWNRSAVNRLLIYNNDLGYNNSIFLDDMQKISYDGEGKVFFSDKINEAMILNWD